MSRLDSATTFRQRGGWPSSRAIRALSMLLVLLSLGTLAARAQTATLTHTGPAPGAPGAICSGLAPTFNLNVTPPTEGTYAVAALGAVAPVGVDGNEVYIQTGAGQFTDEIVFEIAAGNIQRVVGVGDFTFTYFGTQHNLTQEPLFLGANGFIRFSDLLNNTVEVDNQGLEPQVIPDVANPNEAIYFLHTDWNPQAGENVWYEVQDIGNEDVLVITFDNVSQYNENGGPYPYAQSTVQLLIWADGGANAGRVEVRLGNWVDPIFNGDNHLHTIGLENLCGNSAFVANANHNGDTWAVANGAGEVANVAWEFVPNGVNPQGWRARLYATGDGTADSYDMDVAPIGGDLVRSNITAGSPTALTSNTTLPFNAALGLRTFFAIVEFDNCTYIRTPVVTLTVNQSPTAQTPTGPTAVCTEAANTFGVTSTVLNSTFTNWTTTAGANASIVLGTNVTTNDQATITFATAATAPAATTVHTISVDEVSPAGCTTTSTKSVTVYLKPAGTIGGGTSSICAQAPGPVNTPAFNWSGSALSTPGYAWSFTTPAPTGVSISTPTAATTTINVTSAFVQPAAPANMTLQLVVTNGNGIVSPACATTVTTPITINPVPSAKTIVATDATPCQNQQVTYSFDAGTPLFAGNTYAWSASGVAFAYSGADAGYLGAPVLNKGTVTLTWTGFGTGTVTVVETTPAGCTRTHTLTPISIQALPAPTITGDAAPCQFIAATAAGGPGVPSYQTLPSPRQYQYNVNLPNGTSTYVWSLTGGGTIVSGQNTPTIVVQWPTAGAGSVQVTETTAAPYACVGSFTLPVTVTATPAAAAFNLTVVPPNSFTPCAGTTHTYNATGVGNHTFTVVGGTFTGASTYPGTASQRAGAGAGSIVITWGVGATGSISHEYNVAGCGAVETYAITINPLPTGTLDGPSPVCGGTNNVQYSIGNVANGPLTTYAWSEVADANNVATFVGATNTPIATVNYANVWPIVSSTWTIQAIVTNANGCQATIQRVITVNSTPTSPVVAGPATACGSAPSSTSTSNYAVTTVAGVTYTAAVVGAPVGTTVSPAVINGNGAVQNFTVTWGNYVAPNNIAPTSTNVTVNVVATSNNCSSAPTPTVTSVFQRPQVPVINVPALCASMTLPVAVNVTNNGNAGQPSVTYAWSATGGVTFSNGDPSGVTNTITALGGAGNKTFTVVATGPGGCTATLTQVVNVAPTPVPVISGPMTACNELENPAGKPGSGPFSFVYEYTVAAPTNGYSYSWSITNGYVVSWGTGSGNGNANVLGTVAAILPATVNANTVRVVFFGPTPGNVKVSEIHPGGCTGTIDNDVTLNPVPVVQVIGVTPQNICVGSGVTFNQGASEAGFTYRIEKSTNGGLSWNAVGAIATQVGGAPLTWNVPASELTYTTTPATPTTYQFRITAQTGVCGWYTSSNTATVNVYPVPADIPVAIPTNIVCSNDNVTVNVGTVGQPSQAWVLYSLERAAITDANGVAIAPVWGAVAGAAAIGNGTGTIQLTDVTNPAGGNPMLATDNYQYRVTAQIDPALVPPVTCLITMTQQPTARVFALPVPQVVTFTPNPVCWEQDVTATFTASQDGVVYEVLRNGVSMSPVVTVNGAVGNGPVTVVIPALSVLPTNPNPSTASVNFEVRATLRTGAAPYNRPVPASLCPNTFGNTAVTVNPKPVANVTGPATACGPSTEAYTAGPSLVPATYDWTVTTYPAGTTPLVGNNTGVGSVNPFTVNWGTVNLSCDGTYNPFSAQIRMIETNVPYGCADTFFFNTTINPTVADAVINGDAQACIYGGFESHLETYTVVRPNPCVFPANTTYLWTMPTGAVSGVIRSGQGTPSIVAEWHTTGGTNIGTVSVVVTLPPSHGGCATTITHDVIVYPLPVPVVNGPAMVCQGQQNVTYTADLYPTDTYTWQVIGGTIVGGTGNGIVGDTATRSGLALNLIQINWLDEPNQNAFIRLTQISAAGCMNVTTFNLDVNPTPNPVVSGPTSVCDNRVYTYSTQNNAPNSQYVWTVSGNATIQTGANSSQVTVLTGNAGTFTLTVTETITATNCSATTSQVVTVNNAPAPVITRTAPAGGVVGGSCLNQTITYSAVPVVGGRTYRWTVVNGTIVGPNNASSVQVNWNTVGTGTVTLEEWVTASQCTTVVSQNVNVVNPPAPAISGNTNVCGQSNNTYTTPAVAGNSYQWSIVGAGTFTTGTTSNSVGVMFSNPTPGSTLTSTVQVVETNTASGCATTAQLTVTVRYQPQVQVITRNTPAGSANQACNNDVITYGVAANAGAQYQWTVTGGTIIGSSNNPTVQVQWTNIGAQVLTVVETTTGTLCSATSTLNVSVSYKPTPNISGLTTVCTTDEVVYSTPSVPGSTYAWSLPLGGGTITSSTTGNSITVVWNTAGNRSVQLVESNGLCQTTTSVTVTVGQTPTTTAIARVTPAGNVGQACESQTITYSTPANGTSSYLWEATGGIVVGSATSNQVQVKWTVIGNQSLTVTETTTGTNCSKVVTQNVTVTAMPVPNIAGNTISCINKIHTYSTPAVAGHTYQWAITPANVFATVAGYPTDNAITVQWTQPGLHRIIVTETALGGFCVAMDTIFVQVNEVPNPFITSTTGFGSPTVQRPGIVCENSTHTYSVLAPGVGNVFNWTVTGGTIITGQNTSSIVVVWGSSGVGSISVNETVPGSDCSTTKTDALDIRLKPTPSITGNNNPCANGTYEYTTPLVTGNSYTWTVNGPAGTTWTVVSGQPNRIRVIYPNVATATAATITVQEFVNGTLPAPPDPAACATSTTFNLMVRPLPPAITITGNTVVCASDLSDTPATDNIYTYTSSNPSDGTTAAWTISGGQIVGSTTGFSVNARWANASNAPVNGTITVTHTSVFGCVRTQSLTVTINPIPNPSITGPVSVCQGQPQQYSVVGVPGNTYVWSVSGGNIIRSGQNTPNVMVEWTLVGTQTLRVVETNGFGCSVTNDLTVTVNELPTAIIEVSGPTTFCQGGDVTLSAPIGFSSYVWSTGETGRAIVVRTTGEYFVTVTDENGCSNSSDTVTVNVFPTTLPIITSNGPLTFCEGGSVTLTAPAGFDGYVWSTGETTQSIEVSQSGSYTVTVVENSGCTGTSTEVDVFVNPKPAPVLVVVGASTICDADSVEVRAPAGYEQYTWTSQTGQVYGNTSSIWVKTADVVSVEVLDLNGCVGASATVTIEMSPVTTPIVAVNGPTNFCEGNAVTLEAPAGFSQYIWSNGAVGRTITVTESGSFSVTVADDAQCAATSDAIDVTVNPLPARPDIERYGDTLRAVTSATAQGYQWYHNNTLIPGAVESFLVVAVRGSYRVSITDNNECSQISQPFDVIVTDVVDVVAGRSNEPHVYPNPTSGQFTIDAESMSAGTVRIDLVNQLGELVLSTKELSNGGRFTSTINMGTLANGVYNVVVTTDNARWTVRLVRQ